MCISSSSTVAVGLLVRERTSPTAVFLATILFQSKTVGPRIAGGVDGACTAAPTPTAADRVMNATAMSRLVIMDLSRLSEKVGGAMGTGQHRIGLVVVDEAL